MVPALSSSAQECVKCKRLAKTEFYKVPFCKNCFNKFRLFKLNEENTPEDDYLRSLVLPGGKRHVDALNQYSTVFDIMIAVDCVEGFLCVIGKKDEQYVQIIPLLIVARSIMLFGRNTAGYREPTKPMTDMLYLFGGLVCMQMCMRISDTMDDVDHNDAKTMGGIIKEMDSIGVRLSIPTIS